MEKETTTTLTKVEDIPCCPEFDKCPPCDVLDMRRRLSFPTAVRTESGQPVTVEVIRGSVVQTIEVTIGQRN